MIQTNDFLTPKYPSFLRATILKLLRGILWTVIIDVIIIGLFCENFVTSNTLKHISVSTVRPNSGSQVACVVLRTETWLCDVGDALRLFLSGFPGSPGAGHFLYRRLQRLHLRIRTDRLGEDLHHGGPPVTRSLPVVGSTPTQPVLHQCFYLIIMMMILISNYHNLYLKWYYKYLLS